MLSNYLSNAYLPSINDCETIKAIKLNDMPLILWGAGEVAEKVYKILSDNQIDISSVWVDGKCDRDFHGLQPKTIDEILTLYDEFSVVIGHNRYDKIDRLKNEYSKIKQVYYFYNSFNWEEGFDREFYLSHETEFQQAFELSEDDISKQAYSQYICSRIYENPCYVNEKCIVKGYFENDVFSLSDNDVLLEVGAFDGNIIQIFNKETNNQYNKIIALEPDDTNFQRLTKNVCNLHDVELHKIGCWNEKTKLSFCVDGTGKSNHIDESFLSKSTISVDAIDNIIGDENVTFINLFCQTGLNEIIAGAKNTIIRRKPKLIIGIGLRKEQSYIIPNLIKTINSSYKIYYRFYGGVPSRFYMLAV